MKVVQCNELFGGTAHINRPLFLTVKIDLVEVVYNLKQIFHLLCDKSVTPVKALLYFSLILLIVLKYDNMI